MMAAYQLRKFAPPAPRSAPGNPRFRLFLGVLMVTRGDALRRSLRRHVAASRALSARQSEACEVRWDTRGRPPNPNPHPERSSHLPLILGWRDFVRLEPRDAVPLVATKAGGARRIRDWKPGSGLVSRNC